MRYVLNASEIKVFILISFLLFYVRSNILPTHSYMNSFLLSHLFKHTKLCRNTIEIGFITPLLNRIIPVRS